MLIDALMILVLGMGGVFIFLIVLILLIHLIAQLLPVTEVLHSATTQSPGRSQDEQLIAVLQAAVHRYESDMHEQTGK